MVGGFRIEVAVSSVSFSVCVCFCYKPVSLLAQAITTISVTMTKVTDTDANAFYFNLTQLSCLTAVPSFFLAAWQIDELPIEMRHNIYATLCQCHAVWSHAKQPQTQPQPEDICCSQLTQMIVIKCCKCGRQLEDGNWEIQDASWPPQIAAGLDRHFSVSTQRAATSLSTRRMSQLSDI